MRTPKSILNEFLFVAVPVACFALVGFSSVAAAQCQEGRLAAFLEDRVFTLPAEEKIRLYADRVVRYYGKRNVSRRSVLRQMQNWEDRWPDRIYKFIRIDDYEETEDGSACRVVFDYKFIAYDPGRDKTSAGIGRTTLVLAEDDYGEKLRIVAEFGTVRCRGVGKFVQGRC